MKTMLRRIAGALAVLVVGSLAAAPAGAVPSFARQTGMPCSQCHTVSFGPALTAYGRSFKLNGYTFGSQDGWIPLALMVQGGLTHTSADQPDPPADHAATNDNLSLDQVSGFLATRLGQHLGVFAQVTYDGNERHTSWDNVDVRYARQVQFAGTDAVIGVSVNNSPTVQDLWNSTPTWGYPYIGSALAPTPAAASLLDGGLAQVAIGATAYAMIHDHLYLEAGAYRGMSDRWLGNVGLSADDNFHMQGAAPYWRAAWQFNHGDEHYFSVGAFGLSARRRVDPALPDTDRYTDTAIDATHQWVSDRGFSLSTNAVYIHERQNLAGSFANEVSSVASNHLDELRIDSTFAWQQTWSASAALFDVRGGADPAVYAPEPLTGSASGSPDSRGYVLQLEYIPFGKLASYGRAWLNVRVGVQYTAYSRFNGGSRNYDGFDRAAHQNDTLFLYYWFAM
jgi:hypothetical protein